MRLGVRSRNYRSSSASRGIIAGLCGVIALAPGLGYGSVPARAAVRQAPALSIPYEVAFQEEFGNLDTMGANSHGPWSGLQIDYTSSPSVAAVVGGTYAIAFQSTSNVLWIINGSTEKNTGLAMMAGTSPAIAALTGGGYEAAFQGSNGDLWITGSATGTVDKHLGMSKPTSPSITGLTGGGYEAAFQANTGYLWVTGTAGSGSTNLLMKASTSPAIASLENGSYEYAYQASNGSLATGGWNAHGSWGLGMAAATSPAITGLIGSNTGAYEVAFQANTGILWTAGNDGTSNSGDAMYPGSSPSITAWSNGSYEDAYSATAYKGSPGYMTTGGYSPILWGIQMANGATSPSITNEPPPAV